MTWSLFFFSFRLSFFLSFFPQPFQFHTSCFAYPPHFRFLLQFLFRFLFCSVSVQVSSLVSLFSLCPNEPTVNCKGRTSDFLLFKRKPHMIGTTHNSSTTAAIAAIVEAVEAVEAVEKDMENID